MVPMNTQQENQKNNKAVYITVWIVVVVIAILAFGVWYISFRKQPTTQAVLPGSTTTESSTGGNVQVLPPGIIITEPKPQKVSQPAPPLDRSTPASTVDAVVVANINAKMDVTVSNLKKNMTSFQDWIDLGFERKTLGDYSGARDDWEYDSLLYPGNLISFG